MHDLHAVSHDRTKHLYKVADVDLGLSRRSIGHEVTFCMIDHTELDSHIFNQLDWQYFIQGMFAHFVFGEVSIEVTNKMSKN